MAPAEAVQAAMCEEMNGDADSDKTADKDLAGKAGHGAASQPSSNGLANGHGSCHTLANGLVNGAIESRGSASSGEHAARVSMLRRPLAALWRGLSGIGGLLLTGPEQPVAPRLFRAPSGAPALHGVVHQITEADMKQIQVTEGGGGHEKMGYK